MTWNSVMGFVSTLALFLPILLILVLRMGSFRSFPFLLIYYLLVFLYNLMTEGYIRANSDVIYVWGLGNNLLDAPLMLSFLTYFSTSAIFTRRLMILILSIIVFEISVVLLVGYNVEAITIVLGPGIAAVFALCLYFFVRQSKIVITNRKALGKTLITASLVFAYGCYAIIYILYYVFKTPHIADTFLVYFLVAFFSSAILCTGLIFERKRIQKFFELQKARKELLDIYKDNQKIPTFNKVMLDFDRESWN